MINKRIVEVWGGIGEKKSNGGTQWYMQDRIYDSTGLCPALTQYKADYLVVIFIEEERDDIDEQ